MREVKSAVKYEKEEDKGNPNILEFGWGWEIDKIFEIQWWHILKGHFKRW